ncbi:putative transcription regulator protein [Lachnospiraceae bacterium KM106-2]|nr:putative transcription regulator protein [Lachnospiraceae bacterium KM106-2]
MFNRNIYLFISVVEEGSFSAAAKKYLLSQSAVSQQISILEQNLSTKLFDRSNYRPVLTYAGKYFYEHCKEIIQQFKVVENETKRIGKSEKQELRIGITGPFENTHLPGMVADYKKEYPNVDIKIKKGCFGSNAKAVATGELDLAFGIENDFLHIDCIKIVPLFRHSVCVVCSKNHPWAKLEQIDVHDLKDVPIISLSRDVGESFYDDFMEHFRMDGIKPNIVKEVEQLDELFFAIRLNEGIGMLASEVVTSDDLVAIPLAHSHHESTYCIGYHKKNVKEYIYSFIEEAHAYFVKTI